MGARQTIILWFNNGQKSSYVNKRFKMIINKHKMDDVSHVTREDNRGISQARYLDGNNREANWLHHTGTLTKSEITINGISVTVE